MCLLISSRDVFFCLVLLYNNFAAGLINEKQVHLSATILIQWMYVRSVVCVCVSEKENEEKEMKNPTTINRVSNAWEIIAVKYKLNNFEKWWKSCCTQQ